MYGNNVGFVTFSYVLIPNSPLLFNPHTYTYPSFVNAMLWSLLAAIFLIPVKPSFTGTLAVIVPNALFELAPHPHTFPSESNARL